MLGDVAASVEELPRGIAGVGGQLGGSARAGELLQTIDQLGGGAQEAISVRIPR